MKRSLLLALVLFPLMASAQAGTAPQCPLHAACQPGDSVTVESPGLAGEYTLSLATLSPSPGTGQNYTTPVAANGTFLKFVIPHETLDGTYNIKIQKTEKAANAAPAGKTPQNNQNPTPSTQTTDITDLQPSQIIVQRPKITAVSPKAAFLETTDNITKNKITILGNGFRGGEASQGPPHTQFQFTKLRTPDLCQGGKRGDCYELKVDSDSQATLTFYAFKDTQDYYSGPQPFKLSVDGVDTNTENLALIDSDADMPGTVAFVGLALILLLLYGLIHAGKKALQKTFGEKKYFLSALFLDIQTQTYSLSKCQFYAWTAASVLGYLFLAASRSYVQGSATFPDIPSGLPGILLASVGTAVISNGISNAKGDKGAGAPGPNLSDFITSGGVVAADRLQFVVWTIVGIGTFLAIVFRSDPRNISDLPTIPTGFMQLMGLSSAGYIAGKVARKPGPTLNALAPSTPDPPDPDPSFKNALSFQLTGSGLSQSALFSIDGTPIPPDIVFGKDNKNLPEILQLDSTAGENFARVLKFRVKTPSDAWFGGPHDFTITNPDAQKATFSYKIFQIDPASVTLVSSRTDSMNTATLTMKGKCIDKDLKVTSTPSTPPDAQAIEATAVTGINGVTENTYVGTLELPNGVTEVTVTVKDGPGVVFTQPNVKLAPPAPGAPQVTPTPPVGGSGVQQGTVQSSVTIDGTTIKFDPATKTLSMSGAGIDKTLAVTCTPTTPPAPAINVAADESQIKADRYVSAAINLPAGTQEVTVTVKDANDKPILEKTGLKTT